nr:monocarboxylate transporter 2 [Quercus suber]
MELDPALNLIKNVTLETKDTIRVQQVVVDDESQLDGLPPTDGGMGAWMALAGCFVLEALVWGQVSIPLPRYSSYTDTTEQISECRSYHYRSNPNHCNSSYVYVIAFNGIGCAEVSKYEISWRIPRTKMAGWVHGWLWLVVLSWKLSSGGKYRFRCLDIPHILTPLNRFPNAYGIFQSFYLTHEPFSRDPTIIAAIPTTATALMYMSSPLMALAVQRYPNMRFPGAFLGLIIMVAALIGASFSNSATITLATQGVLYAVGGLFLYFPSMYIIDEWFVARKGFAFGVVWTGTGFAAAIVPWLMQWLLDKYGFRTALRVRAVILNRIPISSQRMITKVDFSFLREAPFWIYQFGNTIQATASFLPQLWIPSFALALDLPAYSGALALCLLNIAACGGYLIQGQLCDRFHVSVALLAVTFGSMVSVLVFWGLTTGETMLYATSILWGLTGVSFAATWAGCARALRTATNNLPAGMVISLMCVGKGLGAVISGPISERLLRVGPVPNTGYAYESQYGTLILMTGISVMFGGTAGADTSAESDHHPSSSMEDVAQRSHDVVGRHALRLRITWRSAFVFSRSMKKKKDRNLNSECELELQGRLALVGLVMHALSDSKDVACHEFCSSPACERTIDTV